MIKIRRMIKTDLAFAAECTAEEGWLSESLLEIAGLYAYHPAGCFIAEQDDRPVGTCFGIPYGHFGFLGQLIVKKEARGVGLGRRLVDHTLAHFRSTGVCTVFLDGVFQALSLYERAGFKKLYPSLRFTGRVAGKDHPCVFPMQPGDMEEVCSLDRITFGGDRSIFLKRRYHFNPALCKVAKVDGRILGYIMGHTGHIYLSAGPWVVSPELENPAVLLHALARELPLAPFALGCLGANQQAVDLLRSLGLDERPGSPWRMVYGENVQVGMVAQNYAIGSPAKG